MHRITSQSLFKAILISPFPLSHRLAPILFFFSYTTPSLQFIELNAMTDYLPEEMGNYLATIDLQINSITRNHDPNDDYDKALEDLVVELQQLKTRLQVLALSSQLLVHRVAPRLTTTRLRPGRPMFLFPSPSPPARPDSLSSKTCQSSTPQTTTFSHSA